MNRFLLIAFLLSASTAYSNSHCNSSCTGNWEASASWLPGRVPVNGDTIIIYPNHTVTVTTVNTSLANGNPVYIAVYGTLNFDTGKQLTLSCGSIVSIKDGGKITAGNGGGMSNQLTICNTLVWKAGDGTKAGPIDFTGPLPVDLLYFKGKANKGENVLEWATATETNNSHFEIERSLDGINYSSIATEKGKGTCKTLSLYHKADPSCPPGVNYYRLVQYDYDGAVTFHPIISIKNNKSNLKIFPNPSNGNFNITGTVEGKSIITIRNLLGQKLSVSTMDSISTLEMNSILPNGIYFLTVEDETGGIVFEEKVVVN